MRGGKEGRKRFGRGRSGEKQRGRGGREGVRKQKRCEERDVRIRETLRRELRGVGKQGERCGGTKTGRERYGAWEKCRHRETGT